MALLIIEPMAQILEFLDESFTTEGDGIYMIRERTGSGSLSIEVIPRGWDGETYRNYSITLLPGPYRPCPEPGFHELTAYIGRVLAEHYHFELTDNGVELEFSCELPEPFEWQNVEDMLHFLRNTQQDWAPYLEAAANGEMDCPTALRLFAAEMAQREAADRDPSENEQ